MQIDFVLVRGLESPRHPQAGKPALRSADIPVGGFRRLFRLRGAPKRRYGATAASRLTLSYPDTSTKDNVQMRPAEGRPWF